MIARLVLRRFIPTAAAALALTSCATTRLLCPPGTGVARRYYSGGGESEYCRRPDGVRQGPETRYYENGFLLATGEYADGTVSGVWRYHFNNGRTWRADKWDDGALVSKTVDPPAANLSPEALDALGVTSTGVIKLASHDVRTWREAPEHRRGVYVERYANGRPRVAGDYDGDGLRVGTWRFWYEDGRLAREVEYLAGVRERAAREWHPGGAPAAEGFYVAGEREGMWRWWDTQGRLTGETSYSGGVRTGAPVSFSPAPLPAASPPPPPPPPAPSPAEPVGEPPAGTDVRDGGMLRGQ